MGARQSKRVEISSTPKKGDVENGTLAVAGNEEKLEKIEEGETVATKLNANGSTTTTSTVTAEQQETATTTPKVTLAVESTPSKDVENKTETETDPAEKSISEEISSPAADDSTQEVSSPASPSEATEEGASTEKKKKPKKRWSFRSFSFSKKDKQKPASKEEQKLQETVPEANETASPAEQQNDEEAEKKENKEEEKKADDQVPPPLPTSPPPTPAEEVPVVATEIAVVAAVPEKEETPIISEGDVDASGGGEGLAEPLEDGELEESTRIVTPVGVGTEDGVNGLPLTNGTSDVEMNGKVTENGDASSPVCELKAPVDSVTAKIDSLKLQIASDNADIPAHNGFGDHSFNGDMNGSNDVDSFVCAPASDSVVSDAVDVSVGGDDGGNCGDD